MSSRAVKANRRRKLAEIFPTFGTIVCSVCRSLDVCERERILKVYDARVVADASRSLSTEEGSGRWIAHRQTGC
jgi:hypothetical protein